MSNNNVKAFLAAKEANGDGVDGPKSTDFDAETLTLTLTRPNGEVVATGEAIPRGFKPKNVKGAWVNTLGWMCQLAAARDAGPNSEARPDTTGTYCDVPITGQINLFLGIGKVPSGREPMTLRPDDDTGSDDSDGSDE